MFQRSNNSKRSTQPKLSPKIHQYGIIRLHGRFINADLPEDAQLSILLPRQEHFSKLLIQDIYCKVHYCGVFQMLA